MRINPDARGSSRSRFVSRRRLLGWFSGLAAASFSPLRTSAAAGARLVRRWTTGNRSLVPFTFKNGLLYVAGDRSIEVWNTDRGIPLWRQKLSHPASFRPRIDGKIVLSSGRSLICVRDRNTGRHLWSLKPPGDRQFAVPLLHDGRLFFGQGHEIFAVDAVTGRRLWAFATTPEASSAYAPIAHEGKVFFGPGDGILYAFDAASGRLLWKLDRGRQWQYLRQLHISGDILVAGGYKEHVYGLSTRDGRQLWRFYAGNFINSHLVFDGTVFFWSPTGWIYALDAVSGKRLWRHRTTNYKKKSRAKNWAPVMAELVADQRYLYVLAMDRVLHVLDRKTGNPEGDYALPFAVRPFICLAGAPGRVFLGSIAGEILDFDLGLDA